MDGTRQPDDHREPAETPADGKGAPAGEAGSLKARLRARRADAAGPALAVPGRLEAPGHPYGYGGWSVRLESADEGDVPGESAPTPASAPVRPGGGAARLRQRLRVRKGPRPEAAAGDTATSGMGEGEAGEAVTGGAGAAPAEGQAVRDGDVAAPDRADPEGAGADAVASAFSPEAGSEGPAAEPLDDVNTDAQEAEADEGDRAAADVSRAADTRAVPPGEAPTRELADPIGDAVSGEGTAAAEAEVGRGAGAEVWRAADMGPVTTGELPTRELTNPDWDTASGTVTDTGEAEGDWIAGAADMSGAVESAAVTSGESPARELLDPDVDGASGRDTGAAEAGRGAGANVSRASVTLDEGPAQGSGEADAEKAPESDGDAPGFARAGTFDEGAAQEAAELDGGAPVTDAAGGIADIWEEHADGPTLSDDEAISLAAETVEASPVAVRRETVDISPGGEAAGQVAGEGVEWNPLVAGPDAATEADRLGGDDVAAGVALRNAEGADREPLIAGPDVSDEADRFGSDDIATGDAGLGDGEAAETDPQAGGLEASDEADRLGGDDDATGDAGLGGDGGAESDPLAAGLDASDEADRFGGGEVAAGDAGLGDGEAAERGPLAAGSEFSDEAERFGSDDAAAGGAGLGDGEGAERDPLAVGPGASDEADRVGADEVLAGVAGLGDGEAAEAPASSELAHLDAVEAEIVGNPAAGALGGEAAAEWGGLSAVEAEGDAPFGGEDAFIGGGDALREGGRPAADVEAELAAGLFAEPDEASQRSDDGSEWGEAPARAEELAEEPAPDWDLGTASDEAGGAAQDRLREEPLEDAAALAGDEAGGAAQARLREELLEEAAALASDEAALAGDDADAPDVAEAHGLGRRGEPGDVIRVEEGPAWGATRGAEPGPLAFAELAPTPRAAPSDEEDRPIIAAPPPPRRPLVPLEELGPQPVRDGKADAKREQEAARQRQSLRIAGGGTVMIEDELFRLLDWSTGGIAIASEGHRFRVGDRAELELELDLGDYAVNLDLEGEVVNRSAETTGWRFVAPTPRQQQVLESIARAAADGRAFAAPTKVRRAGPPRRSALGRVGGWLSAPFNAVVAMVVTAALILAMGGVPAELVALVRPPVAPPVVAVRAAVAVERIDLVSREAGTVLDWEAAPGAAVDNGDPLVSLRLNDVEADPGAADVASPCDCVVARILDGPGTPVEAGSTLGRLYRRDMPGHVEALFYPGEEPVPGDLVEVRVPMREDAFTGVVESVGRAADGPATLGLPFAAGADEGLVFVRIRTTPAMPAIFAGDPATVTVRPRPAG